MKQHIQGAGVRQWYGDDMLELQSENLDVIQGFFEQFGPFILQGCAITANGSNWDISAGLACIEHADGWKIVRVAAVTNTTLPGYFTVGKENVSGDYDSGAGTVAYRYHADNAQFTTGSTTAADTKLIIPAPSAGDPTSFNEALLGLSVSAETTQAVSVTEAAGDIYFKVNKAAGLLYIRGELATIASNTITDTVKVKLIDDSVLEADAAFGPYYTDCHFLGIVRNNLGGATQFLDVNGDPITSLPMWIDNNGLHVHLRESASSSYPIYINAVIPIL